MTPTIYFGTPTKHTVTAEFHVSMERARRRLRELGAATTGRLDYSGGVALARNMLLASFVEHRSATHLVLVDDDVAGFNGDEIARIVASDVELAGVPIPGRGLDPASLERALAAGVPPRDAWMHLSPMLYVPMPGEQVASVGDLIEVQAMGTGFMVMARACAERMVTSYANLARTIEGRRFVNVFDFTVTEAGEHVGEDYSFCARWRAIGGRIWADTRASLVHMGMMPFRGRPLAELHALARGDAQAVAGPTSHAK